MIWSELDRILLPLCRKVLPCMQSEIPADRIDLSGLIV